MIEDSPVEANARHETFLADVVRNGILWGLKNDIGWANWSHEDDPKGNIIPFWSKEDAAQACAHCCFPGYQLEALDLDVFVDNFLDLLDQNDIWVGTNLTKEMTGIDMPALELKQTLNIKIAEQGN